MIKNTAKYTVADVDRDRDLTKDLLIEPEMAMHNFNDREAMARAEEEFNNAKVVMVCLMGIERCKVLGR